MTKLCDHHHAIRAELDRHGIKPQIQQTNGGHVRFVWKAGQRRQTIVTAATPSDHRAVKNEIAKVRRLLRGAGIADANGFASSSPAISAAKDTAATESPAPAPAPTDMEARLTRLERDLQMVLDKLTDPARPEPVPTPAPGPGPAVNGFASAPALPVRKPHWRKPVSPNWLWRALRYDKFLPLQEVTRACPGRSYSVVAMTLSVWKKRGFVQHERGKGWRKHRAVEDIGRVTKGQAD